MNILLFLTSFPIVFLFILSFFHPYYLYWISSFCKSLSHKFYSILILTSFLMTTTTYWARMKRQMRALNKKNYYQILNSVWASVCIMLLPSKSCFFCLSIVIFNIYMVVYSRNVATVTSSVYYDFSTLHQCKNLDAYTVRGSGNLIVTVFPIPPLQLVLGVKRSFIRLIRSPITLLWKFLLRRTISSLEKILLDMV